MLSKVKEALQILEADESLSSVNLTDSDAPIMKGKKGDFDTHYNVQSACSEDQIITFCDVVLDGNDKAQLIPALKGIAQNTGKRIHQVLADADYGTFESLAYMSDNGMEGYVPYRDMNKSYDDEPFHSTNFVYDKELDLYLCPAQRHLSFYREAKDVKRKQQFKYYRTDGCLNCPLQTQCCKKGTARRVIKRETRQGLRDEMKQRLNSTQGQQVYRKRLHPIESFFGHLKYNLNYNQFLLRGLEKVKAEFKLICLSYNLRKLATKLAARLTIYCSISTHNPLHPENRYPFYVVHHCGLAFRMVLNNWACIRDSYSRSPC